jgi:N-acetylneuraminic acid mutarotase
MRAFARGTVSPAIHLFAWALALSAGGAVMVACADSIHLDPPGGTGGKGTTSTHSTGGGASSECRSNPDCSYPTPVCDTVASKCVECLVLSDCAGKPGTVCSAGACTCPSDGPKLDFCPASGGAGPRCVDTQTSENDCGGCGHGCFGACSGGKCADAWSKITSIGAPSPRSHHVAVWTGSKMFVWGGSTAGGPTNSGGVYDPGTDSWSAVSVVDAPSPRSDATAVWDPVESVVIVWGGLGPAGVELGTGAMYHPGSDTWTPMTYDAAGGTSPSPRHGHTAVWASFDPNQKFGGMLDHGMIVWGGNTAGGTPLDTGAVFDPKNNTWTGATMTDPINAPQARGDHTAVWDDQHFQMIVFGGTGKAGPDPYFGDLWLWNAGGNTWSPDMTMSSSSPVGRARHAAVWDVTGHSMYIAAGADLGGQLGDFARYAPAAGWGQPPSTSGSPIAREGHTAVWIAGSMIVFGGINGGTYLAGGYSVNGATLTWNALPTAPSARAHHTAVTDGTKMFVWGGDGVGGLLGDGAIYDTTP